MSDSKPSVLLFIAICLVILSCGCMDQPPQRRRPEPPVVVVPPKPEPIVPVPDPINDLKEPPTLSVSMPESLLATIHEVLGDSGTIFFNPTTAVKIQRPDLSIVFPIGMSFSFSITNGKGLISFADPKPTVEARAAGLKLTPHLTKVELLADNTGFATVQGSLYTKRQAFDLRTVGAAETIEDHSRNEPADLEDVAPDETPRIIEPVPLPQEIGPQRPDNRPVVTLYTAGWCLVCKSAKAELESAADTLPFRVRLDTRLPDWITNDPNGGLPTLYWEGSHGWWKQKGWSSVGEFLKVWNRKNQ